MVGAGALIECLADPRVRSVLAVTRSPIDRTHPKLREVIHHDFFVYDTLREDFATCDACVFCLGVSSVGMSEVTYTRLTYDLTLAAAHAMADVNTRLTFCYVSGVGTDSTERGRTMWARVKGRTENALLALPFKAAYMFRPGYIQPVGGVRLKTAWVQAALTVVAPLTRPAPATAAIYDYDHAHGTCPDPGRRRRLRQADPVLPRHQRLG